MTLIKEMMAFIDWGHRTFGPDWPVSREADDDAHEAAAIAADEVRTSNKTWDAEYRRVYEESYRAAASEKR